MQFYTIHEILPAYGKETVFRQSVLGKFLFFRICLLLSATLLWFARAGGYDSDDMHLPPALLYWIGPVAGFLAVLGYFYFRVSLKPSNWLVRSSVDRLVIKFHSPLNDHFPDDDPVIVVVPFAEIAWIRRARETLSNPSSSGDGDRIESLSFVDVKLNAEDVKTLGDVLRAERVREAPRVGFSRTKHHHYPVRLVDDDILRIQWGGVRTRIKKALKMLGKRLSGEPDSKIRNAAWEELEGKELEDRILDLLERGDAIGATAFVKTKYGYSTTEAKNFTDEMMSPTE